jgi:hypothetical protein
MMNSSNSKYKMSKIERETNKQILIVFVVQFLFCFAGALVCALWQYNMQDATYLAYNYNSSVWDTNLALLIVKSTGTWILIFT